MIRDRKEMPRRPIEIDLNGPDGNAFVLLSLAAKLGKQIGMSYDEIERIAKKEQPKMIIAGASAYSRDIDFKRFREIADKVGAYLMVDMAHFSGLVAGKGYPNPCDYAHVVTSTTHKVFRSARGGIILSNDIDLGKKFDTAVFPGYQGGPLMHIIAAKAAGFFEALKPEFQTYIKNVLANAKMLAETLKNNGFKIYSGGTDTHLMLVDLRPFNVKGNLASESLCRANITCNKNGIPFDTQSPMITSGIRLGTPACTTRGFGTKEFTLVGELITKVINGLSMIVASSPVVQPLCMTANAILTHAVDDPSRIT